MTTLPPLGTFDNTIIALSVIGVFIIVGIIVSCVCLRCYQCYPCVHVPIPCPRPPYGSKEGSVDTKTQS